MLQQVCDGLHAVACAAALPHGHNMNGNLVYRVSKHLSMSCLVNDVLNFAR